jgi:hypothetical protein
VSNGSGILEEDWRRGRRGSSSARLWQGSRAQRGRVALRLPQVVVKVTGKSRGLAKVRARLWYVSQEGSLALEREDGTTVEGRAELEQLLADWSPHFTTRANGRDTVQLSFSVPESEVQGSEEARARVLDAVRATARAEWGGNHPYVFAAHRDSGNFHVHVIVRSAGRDGRSVPTKKADLERWRVRFAAEARERGLWVDASPRPARGRTTRNVSTAVHRKRERGEPLRPGPVPRAAEAAIWEERLRARNARERRAYAQQAAETVREASGLSDSRARAQALRLGVELGRYAMELPFETPRSEQQRGAVQLDVRAEGAEEVRRAVAELPGQGSVAVASSPRGWVSVEQAVELTEGWGASAVRVRFVAQAPEFVGRAEQGRIGVGVVTAALRAAGVVRGYALRAEVIEGEVRIHGVVDDPERRLASAFPALQRRFAQSAEVRGYRVEAQEERPGIEEVRAPLREVLRSAELAARALPASEREDLTRQIRALLRSIDREVEQEEEPELER